MTPALLVAAPVSVGLLGNTSVAQSITVSVPSHAVVVDDHGGQSKLPAVEPHAADTSVRTRPFGKDRTVRDPQAVS